MPEESDDTDEQTEDESTTRSTRERWQYLSTVVVMAMTVSFIALGFLVAVGQATWPEGPLGTTLRLAFMLAMLYVVGPSAVAAYKELKK